jgi:hypothetical protein
MNNLALCVALATAPSRAFGELRERPRFWFPLLLLAASTGVIVFWYYNMVDFEWLKDAVYGNNPGIQKLPEAGRATAMALITRNTMVAISLIGTSVVLPVFFLLQALYLVLAAKVTKVPLGFKHWFAFSCWTSPPLLLTTVVSAIFLIMSDTTQLSPSVLQPLSINELVLHRPSGSPGYNLLESLSIPSMLSWVLMIIGVHVWSRRSWAFSAIFIVLPVVVIYGSWAAFAFR